MATVKKMKKYNDGGDIPCPGGNCRPSRSSKPSVSVGASTSGGKGRGNVVTKADEEAGRKQRLGERIMSSAKKIVPQSTAPGVRPGEESNKYKKGSQSLFGGDKYASEAKYGKKVAKKSAVKKAKVGTKLKSKKK